MSKRSDDDHCSERYKFRSRVRRVQSGQRVASQRHEDVEARINRTASKRGTKNLALNFVIFTCVFGFVVGWVVFSIAGDRVPSVTRFEAISDYFGLVVLVALIGGTVWTLAVMTRGGRRR